MPIDVGLPPISFKGRSTAAQTLDTGVYTTVALNNPRFTATRPCLVVVSAAVLFDAGQTYTVGNANSDRSGAVFKNGAVLEGTAVWGAYSGRSLTLTIPIMPVDLGTGDYLELKAYGGLTGTRLYADASGMGSVMTIWER